MAALAELAAGGSPAGRFGAAAGTPAAAGGAPWGLGAGEVVIEDAVPRQAAQEAAWSAWHSMHSMASSAGREGAEGPQGAGAEGLAGAELAFGAEPAADLQQAPAPVVAAGEEGGDLASLLAGLTLGSAHSSQLESWPSAWGSVLALDGRASAGSMHSSGLVVAAEVAEAYAAQQAPAPLGGGFGFGAGAGLSLSLGTRAGSPFGEVSEEGRQAGEGASASAGDGSEGSSQMGSPLAELPLASEEEDEEGRGAVHAAAGSEAGHAGEPAGLSPVGSEEWEVVSEEEGQGDERAEEEGGVAVPA
jgi:hypothetical protein